MDPKNSPNSSTTESRPTTILVIEDDDLVRKSMTAILGVYGLNVLLADSGRTGLEIFESRMNEINVILLDFTLPDMAGTTVFEKIRSLRRDMPVIVTSGYAEDSVIAQFSSEEKLLFLPKPSPFGVLIAKIKQAIGK